MLDIEDFLVKLGLHVMKHLCVEFSIGKLELFDAPLIAIVRKPITIFIQIQLAINQIGSRHNSIDLEVLWVTVHIISRAWQRIIGVEQVLIKIMQDFLIG